MIKFFNTYSGKIEPFHPTQAGEVKLYTCGPTVYDYAHVGNFRAYLFEDLLKRFLVFMGYKVTHVMNITDVDDKTIKGARKQGISLEEYTKKYIQSFFADIEALNVSKADYYPRATENIKGMVNLVKMLLNRGYAYEKDGSYYFNISKFKDYGKLSKVNLTDLKAGIRVDSDEYEKESVHDFALWKAKKEGEPFWETEIGAGRPGWHIECSVMSSKYLGDTFDIHCGGVDNIFPHHENEIAQSEAATGKKLAHYWLHCQHLTRDFEKMSKSKGNIVTLKDLTENHGTDPLALRLLLLSTHYRKMLNFTLEALNQSQSSLQRINDFVNQLGNIPLQEGENKQVAGLADNMKKKFIAGLSHDLNISSALTALFGMIKKANILISQKAIFKTDAEKLLSVVASIDRVLAVTSFPKHIKVSYESPIGDSTKIDILDRYLPEEIELKIKQREDARKEKNYALADQIRDELLQRGIILEDTKDGIRWKIAPKK